MLNIFIIETAQDLLWHTTGETLWKWHGQNYINTRFNLQCQIFNLDPYRINTIKMNNTTPSL